MNTVYAHGIETVFFKRKTHAIISHYIPFHSIHWFAVRCMSFSILGRLFLRFGLIQLSWVEFHSLSPSFAFISLFFARKFAFRVLFASIPNNLLAFSLSLFSLFISCSLFCWCCFLLLSRSLDFHKRDIIDSKPLTMPLNNICYKYYTTTQAVRMAKKNCGCQMLRETKKCIDAMLVSVCTLRWQTATKKKTTINFFSK